MAYLRKKAHSARSAYLHNEGGGSASITITRWQVAVLAVLDMACQCDVDADAHSVQCASEQTETSNTLGGTS